MLTTKLEHVSLGFNDSFFFFYTTQLQRKIQNVRRRDLCLLITERFAILFRKMDTFHETNKRINATLLNNFHVISVIKFTCTGVIN